MKLELERVRQCTDYNLAVCVLASGSRGNAIFISDGTTGLLLDAGLSASEIKRRLQSRGLSPKCLDAILLSHEHSDHIQSVGVLSRQLKLPIYLSRKIKKKAPLGNSVHELRTFECGRPFQINAMKVHPFSVSHDATDPVGFIIGQNGRRIGVATDLGFVTPQLTAHLQDCHLLILEANHDPGMLMNGPYPWPLKKRIQGHRGHLSNQQSRHLLQELQHRHLQHVILAHLSETNNNPKKALAEVTSAFSRHKPRLTVASQHHSSEIIYLK